MNRKNLTAAVLAGLAGVAGIAGTAQAVNLNPDGLGEVLIYPYYTTNDGNITLLTVVNTTSDAKAVKVRFIEGFNSREVLDFNLYLSEFDVWTAALADSSAFGAAPGVPHMLTQDTSCTVPYLYDIAYNEALGGGLQAFLPYQFTGDFTDGGRTDIGRAAEGYFEIIEMGVLTDDDAVKKDELEADVGPHAARIGSATAATHVIKEDEDGNEYVEPENCDILVQNWTRYLGNASKPHPLAGWWAADSDKCAFDLDDPFNSLADGCDQADWAYFPESDVLLTSTDPNAGGLFGAASVINVGRGTMFSYDARAVMGFDTTADGIHFEPGTIHPSVNDGSVLDAFVTVVGGPGNPPTVQALSYGRSADAVSAVFMHDTLANTFTIEEELNAATEWVVTFPTKNWYADENLLGQFSFYTPDPDDIGCNGWDPGEPNPYIPPVYTAGSGPGGQWQPGDPIPDNSNTTPPTSEDWSTCTPIKASVNNPALAPFTTRFDGQACEPVSLRVWDREESPTLPGGAIIPPIVSPAPPGSAPPGEAPFELCYEVNVLRFGETSIFGSDLYDDDGLALSVGQTPVNGWGRITFGADDANCVACSDDDIELHQDSNGLRGLPVTGFAAEQYVNGTLEGGVLANYGGLFGHKGSVRVEACTLPEGCASELNPQ